MTEAICPNCGFRMTEHMAQPLEPEQWRQAIPEIEENLIFQKQVDALDPNSDHPE